LTIICVEGFLFCCIYIRTVYDRIKQKLLVNKKNIKILVFNSSIFILAKYLFYMGMASIFIFNVFDSKYLIYHVKMFFTIPYSPMTCMYFAL